MNELLCPSIRFNDYKDSWEEHALGEIVTIVERPITIMDEDTYQLVVVKNKNKGVVSRGFFKGKNILVKNYFKLKKGDFIISKRQIVHGASGYVPDSLDGAVVSNEYLVLISNTDVTSEYLSLISQREEMYRLYFLSSYGVDIEKMVFNVTDWKKRTIVIPKVSEQKAITTLFSQMDSLINLYQERCEKLINFKKALLEKLFPKNVKDNPRVRFKQFDKNWKQFRLAELCEIVKGKQLGKKLFIADGKYYILNGGINPSGRTNDYNCGPNTISISEGGNSCGYVNFNTEKFWSGGHNYTLRIKESVNEKYLFQFLKSRQEEIMSLRVGSGLPNIQKTSIEDFSVIVSLSDDEQKMIGESMLYVDFLINQQQKKLEKVKSVRKSLLNAMFV